MEPPTPTDNHPFRNKNNNHQNSIPSRLQTTFPLHISSSTTGTPSLNPAFLQKLREMALPLAPFVQLTTGSIHPHFPSTLLHFWLLTESQLDELASFYHQSPPCEWTNLYPCPIVYSARDLSLEEKRRKMGKFIGLRGCETPVVGVDEQGRVIWGRTKTEEEIEEDARRERMAGRGSQEDEIRRKMGWY